MSNDPVVRFEPPTDSPLAHLQNVEKSVRAAAVDVQPQTKRWVRMLNLLLTVLLISLLGLYPRMSWGEVTAVLLGLIFTAPVAISQRAADFQGDMFRPKLVQRMIAHLKRTIALRLPD
jgi:hypothetical protein